MQEGGNVYVRNIHSALSRHTRPDSTNKPSQHPKPSQHEQARQHEQAQAARASPSEAMGAWAVAYQDIRDCQELGGNAEALALAPGDPAGVLVSHPRVGTFGQMQLWTGQEALPGDCEVCEAGRWHVYELVGRARPTG